MSETFEVKSSFGSYEVQIASGAANALLDVRPAAVICDERFAAAFEGSGLLVLSTEAKEDSKSIDVSARILVDLRRNGVVRSDTLAVMGGGIIQDLGCFCASVYMRAVPWVYYPTTLLGMVDSCIGGKSSINVGGYKNIVGTFHPPRAVIVDPLLAGSLSDEQWVAGLCEAAKICFVRGDEAFKAYLALEPSPHMAVDRLSAIITASLTAKKWFIEIDEFDQRERLLLNFGHTFGHAIEAASHFQVGHGIAVGLGMLAAEECARRIGTLQADSTGVATLRRHITSLLGTLPWLKEMMRTVSQDEAVKAFISDKKHSHDAFSVIVPGANSGVERIKLPRDGATIACVANAFGHIIKGNW